MMLRGRFLGARVQTDDDGSTRIQWQNEEMVFPSCKVSLRSLVSFT